jgi:hypothetical protein
MVARIFLLVDSDHSSGIDRRLLPDPRHETSKRVAADDALARPA